MTVDVLYEGLAIAKGAAAREESGGLFVELEAPMPVGTRLVIHDGGGERAARVTHVHEGIGPGVLIVFEAPKAASPEPEPAAAPDAAANGKPDDDAPKGGRKRKNTRKTAVGH
jgi:hypothetical protein